MQRTDLRGNAEQERQAAENKRQGYRLGKQQLHHQTASGKQAAADNQAFEKALMRGIKTGNVAAGGNEREEQAQM